MISLKTKDWMIEDIDAIFFDKDGTFIDLHYFWGKMTEMRCLEIIKRFNLESTLLKTLCLFLGYDLETKKMLSDGITAMYSRSKIIEIFRGNLLELKVETSEGELTEIFDFVSLEFYKEIEKYTRPIEEAIDFIKKVKAKGIKTAIVTSDSVESTNLTIKNFGWEKLFDVVVGRESSQETKESGTLTRIALDNLKADAKKTVMIGDAPMDYISAKNAGINNTILVATGQIGVNELKKYTPYVLESLKELECLKI